MNRLDYLLSLMNERHQNKPPKNTYVISRRYNDKSWYLFDIDDKLTPRRVVWTRLMKEATHFTSEQDAERICNKYFKDQIVEIICNVNIIINTAG